MKKKSIILIGIVSILSGCAKNMDGRAYDAYAKMYSAIEYCSNNGQWSADLAMKATSAYAYSLKGYKYDIAILSRDIDRVRESMPSNVCSEARNAVYKMIARAESDKADYKKGIKALSDLNEQLKPRFTNCSINSQFINCTHY
jgi:hypothetical protein